MKKIVVSGIAFCLIVATAVLALPSSQLASANDDRSISLDVELLPQDEASNGEGCGLFAQVIVTNAEGAIVGKLDLADRESLYTADPSFPGTVEDGLCIISDSIDVPDSPYYTFNIDGPDGFTWTMSAEELASDEWNMYIQYFRF